LAPTERRKTEAGAAVTAYQREAAVGAWTNKWGVFFYSCALHGGNAGLRKEGEREVTARRGGRATGVHTRVARRSSDVAVVADLRGGDTDCVCPYAVGTSELARGWR
jgi:hypothetical protein